jgi:hypothetical protein
MSARENARSGLVSDLVESCGLNEMYEDDVLAFLAKYDAQHRTQVLGEGADNLQADVREWQTEQRWRDGNGDSRGPGVGHAITRLRRMADVAEQGEKATPAGEAAPHVTVSHYIETRFPAGSNVWTRLGVRFSWRSRDKANEKLAAIRERLPHAEHRLMTRTTVVTEAPTEGDDR